MDILNAFKSLEEVCDDVKEVKQTERKKLKEAIDDVKAERKALPDKSIRNHKDIAKEEKPIRDVSRIGKAKVEKEDSDERTLRDEFEEQGIYAITIPFDIEGTPFTLFCEAVDEEGNSCDITYADFDLENISSVLVELLDADFNFIGSLTRELEKSFTLEDSMEEIEEIAKDFRNLDDGDDEAPIDVDGDDIYRERKEHQFDNAEDEHPQDEDLQEEVNNGWLGFDCDKETATNVKDFLRKNNLYFEPSSNGNDIHFEVKISDEADEQKINDYINSFSESLREEYGPYKGDDFMEDIADSLEAGWWYGSYISYDEGTSGEWELTINDKNGKSFSSNFVLDYILNDISYPVRDGHLNYYGLDEFVDRNNVDDIEDVVQGLKELGCDAEEVDAWANGSGDDEFEFYIDYDIDLTENEDDEDDEDRASEINDEIGGRAIYDGDDETLYAEYENGKLYAGSVTNSGMFHDYEIDYDEDISLDQNLQNLYDEIMRCKNGEGIKSESLKEGLEEPYVIYKELGEFKGTPKSNYEATIRNAHKIIDFSDFESVEQIKKYIGKYFKGENNEIIDKTNESLKEGISSGLSFNKDDLQKVKDKVNSFEFKDLVEINEKPNKYGICHIWIDTMGLSTEEEKKVEDFIKDIESIINLDESLKEGKEKRYSWLITVGVAVTKEQFAKIKEYGLESHPIRHDLNPNNYTIVGTAEQIAKFGNEVVGGQMKGITAQDIADAVNHPMSSVCELSEALKRDREQNIRYKGLKESKEFKISNEKDMQDAKEILTKDNEDETIEKVVDVNARVNGGLKGSYKGDIILQCPSCKEWYYIEPEQLKKDEDGELYNKDDECMNCGAKEGFELIGQVASLGAEDEEQPTQEETPIEEPIETQEDENNQEQAEQPQEETEEEREENKRFESLDDDRFNKIASKFLGEGCTYELTKGIVGKNKLVLEGKLTDKNGETKSSKFVFETKYNKDGKIRMCGLNESLGKKRITLIGKIKDNNLTCETLR